MGKNVKGAKDGTIFTVKFKGNGKELHTNSPTKALMLLSIACNKFCWNQYLQTSAKQATEECDFTTFLIADEIYWHNLKPLAVHSEKDIATLKAQALEMGESYFTKNLTAFLACFNNETREHLLESCQNKTVDEQIELINREAAKLPKKFEILRWNAWVNREGYQDVKAELEDLYQQEESLRTSIVQTALEFVKRHKNENKEELWLMRSNDYLTEESPAIMWLGARQDYNYVIYPGDIIPAFKVTKDFFVVNNNELDLLQRPFVIPKEDKNKCLIWLQPLFKKHKPVPTVQNNFTFFDTTKIDQQKLTGICVINDIYSRTLASDKPFSDAVQLSILDAMPKITQLSESERTKTMYIMQALLHSMNIEQNETTISNGNGLK